MIVGVLYGISSRCCERDLGVARVGRDAVMFNRPN
jgi:hypothetical protein